MQSRTAAASPTAGFRRRDWLLAAAAIAVALGGVALVYFLFLAPDVTKGNRPSTATRAELLERQSKAQKLLAEGSFRLAAEALRPSSEDVDLNPLSPTEQRTWKQVERQAALLADLLTEPLEDIVNHAAAVRNPDEWSADFAKRYRGKALLFDTEVRRQPGGAWEMLYPLARGREKAHIHVDDLKLLQKVPQPGPERVLLGVRLAGLRLEAPGPVWVVRFEPDSGVFLTDAGAAMRACPALGDAETTKLTLRMALWLE